MIDTTTLGNGLHTIAWSASDDAGAADGLGSRYFIVANGAGLLTGAMTGVDDSNPGESATLTAAAQLMMPAGAGAALSGAVRGDAAVVLRDEVDAARLDAGPIVVSRGWNFDAPGRQLRANASGLTTRAERGARSHGAAAGERPATVFRLPARRRRARAAANRIAARGQLGVFTWQPGVGFIGAYDFVFVRWAGGRALARQEVRVVLNPKGSGRVGPQVMIDLPSPAAAASIAQPFVVAGWAADLDAASGPGVDALHVWAYPRTAARRSSSAPRPPADAVLMSARCSAISSATAATASSSTRSRLAPTISRCSHGAPCATGSCRRRWCG